VAVSGALWLTIWFMVILKIPAIYLAYVIWWAVKDPPAPETGAAGDGFGGGIGPPWRPPTRRPAPGRHPGPHGAPVRRPADGPVRVRAKRLA
jgi:hypothetical protein